MCRSRMIQWWPEYANTAPTFLVKPIHRSLVRAAILKIVSMAPPAIRSIQIKPVPVHPVVPRWHLRQTCCLQQRVLTMAAACARRRLSAVLPASDHRPVRCLILTVPWRLTPSACWGRWGAMLLIHTYCCARRCRLIAAILSALLRRPYQRLWSRLICRLSGRQYQRTSTVVRWTIKSHRSFLRAPISLKVCFENTRKQHRSCLTYTRFLKCCAAWCSPPHTVKTCRSIAIRLARTSSTIQTVDWR